MKFILTGRAPHLGEGGKTVELTASQAVYERLRGHLVPPVSSIDLPEGHVDLPSAPAVKVAKRGRKRS